MKKTTGKILIVLAVLAVIVAIVALKPKKSEDFSEKYAGVDLSVNNDSAAGEGTYTDYMNVYADFDKPEYSVDVDLSTYVSGEGVELYNDYNGEANALYTSTDSTVTWNVDLPKAGLYNIYIEYMPMESRGVAIERSVYINGKAPFSEANNILFKRAWTDASEPQVDGAGNQVRPSQKEVYDWQAAYFMDSVGYVTEPYQFYFEQGENTLTLEGVDEPMVLRKVEIKAVESSYTYEDYLADNADMQDDAAALNHVEIIEGEDAVLRSESSLYAKYDKSSPNTHPYSVTNTILNIIGGEQWSSSGQWIEWEFDVPEDGFYNITVKGRQNYERGSVSSRKVYIDGTVPFDELKEISFGYDTDWNCMTLADESGQPYKIYLEKGAHTLRLEATLGGAGSILGELEDSIFRLNLMYRKLLVYTGATPDQYRDYNIEDVYPEIIEEMGLEAKRLFKVVDDMVAYTGQKTDKIATAQTLAIQLEGFVEAPNKITEDFTTFKDNITALGTSVLEMSSSKLDVDYIAVSSTDTKPEKDEANFIDKLVHEVKSFVATFVVDYDAVGNVYEDTDDVVTVWILSGRDQGTILKTMVDDEFTPETGVKVNVEIIAADALLSAVMAGKGPDVVLSVPEDQPVNYALRGAAEDLTQFADYEEVLSDYTKSAYTRYTLEDGIYGIPETQTFNVMFYRTDVLEELGLEVPNTWQELIEMLPTIQGNNLSIKLPSAVESDLSMYYSLLYQCDGELYNEEGTKSVVDSEEGLEAFELYTRFFTDYGVPTSADFVSRFRSGEMPLGIANYSIYNTLMVSAPEIRGLWDFTLIPGTEKLDENGNQIIDRTNSTGGTASMMIATDDEEIKARSWEFMKWWSETDTQVRFGREVESLLGSSARYATANVNAFSQLAWSVDDIEVLMEQWKQTEGVREVPGGYYTGEHLNNAVRKVINEASSSRETILDYTITINEEIAKKRLELGMTVE